jgi:hypothetical protein
MHHVVCESAVPASLPMCPPLPPQGQGTGWAAAASSRITRTRLKYMRLLTRQAWAMKRACSALLRTWLGSGLGGRSEQLLEAWVLLIKDNLALIVHVVVTAKGAEQRLEEVGGEPAGAGLRLPAATAKGK